MLDNLRSWAAWTIAPDGIKKANNGDFIQAILGGTGSGFGRRSLASTPELLQAYNHQPWLRAAVHKISYSVSNVTWRLFVARGGNGKVYEGVRKLQNCNDWRQRQGMMKYMSKEVEFIEIEEHPLLDVLSGGSDLFPGTITTQLSQAYIDLVGESFQLKERSGMLTNETSRRGAVENLVPIPPHWVSELPTPSSPYFEIRFGMSGVPELVPKEDVIFFRDPNPFNPYGRGSGTSRALGDELQSNEAAARTIRSRLENNSIPPFIAMPEGDGMPPDETQLARIRDEWQKRLRGPDKSGFVHFLKTKFSFEKLGNTFEELSLIPLLQNQRDTILQVFGLPPEILGILTNSNRATIDAAEALYSMNVVKPRMEFKRSGYQQSLVPDFDPRLILEFESPVPDDKEYELNVMKSVPWAFMADELRERAGYEAIPEDGGKVFGVPAAVILQSSLTGEAIDGDDEEPEDDEPEDDDDDMSDMPGDGEDGDDDSDSPMPPEDEGRAPARRLAAPRGSAKGGLVRRGPRVHIGEHVSELCIPLTHSKEQNREGLLVAISNVISDEATVRAVIPVLRDAIQEAGERQMDELLKPTRAKVDEPEISIAFDIQDPTVIQFVSEEAGDKIVGINKRTRGLVRKTLREGLENGESVNQLAKRLRGTYSGFAGRRSVTIARTESIGALNAGQVAGTRQAGFEGKQWLSTRDGRVRDTHAVGSGLDGQIVAVDADFVSPSGATGQFPGAMSSAAESVNCRCTTLAVAKVDGTRGWPKWLNTEEKRVQYWLALEQHRVPIERKLRRVWRRVFDLQEQELIRALGSLIDN